VGAGAPQGKKKCLGAELMEISFKCTPDGKSAPPRRGGVTFYWTEEDAAFNLGVFHRVRITTKKVISISG